MVIEEITKASVDELASQKIFNPIGMERTGYIWHDSFGDENVAVGHYNDNRIDKKRKRTTGVAGGSLVTTIADYSKFIEHVMNKKSLSQKYFEEMITPQINIYSETQFPPITNVTTTENRKINLAYGLGWGLIDCSFGKGFFKEGNGDSWRNYNINFIDKGISIIIMVNSENGESIYQEIIESFIGDTCIPWKWQGYIPYNGKK